MNFIYKLCKKTKYLINYFFGDLIFSFIKNKVFLYVDNRFLGSFINLMYYKLSLNKNAIIIFDPKFFKRKSYLQYALFEQAYYDIKKKKLNILSNYILYFFFRILGDKYKKYFRFKWSQEIYNLFIKNDKILFDPFISKNQYKDENFNKLKNNNFLLFSCRDNAYKEKIHGNSLNYHSYRNESLINYEKSFHSLKKQYDIVRFGSVASKKIISDGIFDYSFSEDRNEINDLSLIKNCYIYIGTGSGPDILAINYQKPIVYTNWTHPLNVYCFHSPINLIFKKIFDKKNNEYIPYKKLIDKNNLGVSGKPLSLLSTMQEYEDNQLMCEENTPDEIENAIKELDMFLRKKYTFNSNNQDYFRKIFRLNSDNPMSSNFFISDYFINKNKKLFI
jgi:putative glycosyltransferase (TIGR04372 family)